MTAAAERKFMAQKIWGRSLDGWSRPHWQLVEKERKWLAMWEKRKHIELDGFGMMRLTEAGRAALIPNGNGKDAAT